MRNLDSLGIRLDGESLPHTLAKLLRLTQPEAELLVILFDAEAGLSPAQLRQMAPAVYSPSLVAITLNRKLAAAGLGGVRVVNSCQRMGPGRQLSVWRLVDEPSHDVVAA